MKQMKYEEAMKELEAIVAKMEDGQLDIDSLTEELKKAQKLIKMCKAKLKQTDSSIQKLLEEE